MWQHVRDHVLASIEYQVDPSQITIVPPPPPWIHSDIKPEIVRDASLDGPLSLVDGQLTVRMASVFSSHPWVAHVRARRASVIRPGWKSCSPIGGRWRWSK